MWINLTQTTIQWLSMQFINFDGFQQSLFIILNSMCFIGFHCSLYESKCFVNVFQWHLNHFLWFSLVSINLNMIHGFQFFYAITNTFQNIKIYQHIKLPTYLNIKISTYHNIKISKYQRNKISTYQNINISKYQNVNISTYQHINISKYQYIKISKYQNI